MAKYGRNPYQIWVSADTKGTQSPALDFVKALQSDSHLNTEIKMKFGESYQHGAEINVNVSFIIILQLFKVNVYVIIVKRAEMYNFTFTI